MEFGQKKFRELDLFDFLHIFKIKRQNKDRIGIRQKGCPQILLIQFEYLGKNPDFKL